MSNLYDDLPVHDSLDGVWRGVVATNSSAIDDTIKVKIRAFDNVNRFGPCRWMPRNATELPSRGDECLVVFAEDQMPYVIAWWPS